MSGLGTTREVLIAEAIGDLGRLLDRAEALQQALLESTQALVDARAILAGQLAAFDAHVIALAERAKVIAVRHILAKTEEAARRSVESQTRAMADAAQVLFKTEITPALQRLAMPLQQLVQRVDRPWEQWLTHAATAAVASVLTWTLLTWPWAR